MGLFLKSNRVPIDTILGIYFYAMRLKAGQVIERSLRSRRCLIMIHKTSAVVSFWDIQGIKKRLPQCGTAWWLVVDGFRGLVARFPVGFA